LRKILLISINKVSISPEIRI